MHGATIKYINFNNYVRLATCFDPYMIIISPSIESSQQNIKTLRTLLGSELRSTKSWAFSIQMFYFTFDIGCLDFILGSDRSRRCVLDLEVGIFGDNTIQYNTIQYNTIQYNTIQYYKI